MNTQEAKDRAAILLHQTDDRIRDNPVPSLLAAFGIGFAIGLLTRRIEPAPKRAPWQQTLDDLRTLAATGTQRGKEACTHSADALRAALEHAADTARHLDVEPMAKWWKKLWS